MFGTSFDHIKRSYSSRKLFLPIAALLAVGGFSLGFLAGSYYPKVLGKYTVSRTQLPAQPNPESDLPLRKYSLQNLQNYEFQVSEITLDRVIEKQPGYTGYLFSYRTLGKKMTGQINVPNTNSAEPFPIIVMVRGYVDAEEFQTGSGTKSTAAEFAKGGYVTIAPDFLGFGGSAPAGPGWEERFEKPVNVIELIKSIRGHKQLAFKNQEFRINPDRMGLWAHSNGGQITLATLEALGESIPTTLWAPVTAPFPYSVLFYSDEMDDGGRGMRSAVAGFEQRYNVQEYSLTQYLHRLQGPIQLHQGSVDDAVPQKWSDEFVKKITDENKRRQTVKDAQLAEATRIASQAAALAATPAPSASPLATPTTPTTASTTPSASLSPLSPLSAIASSSAVPGAAPIDATTSANSVLKILADAPQPIANQIRTEIKVEDAFLRPIDISYFVYKGADHGLFPNSSREEAVARDLRFFGQQLKKN